MTRPSRLRRRWTSLAVAVLGALLATAALVPAGTSAAWQDRVYAASEVVILPGVVPEDIDAGSGFTCAIVAGNLWCWGEGSAGQLGVGSTADSDVPVSAGDGVTAMVEGTGEDVTAGNGYACGAAGGLAYCWGEGGGRLGNFDVATPWETPAETLPTPVYAQPAGTGNQYESPLAGQTVVEVVAGEYMTCARAETGTAACWGQNSGLVRPPAPAPQNWANAPIALPTTAQDPLSQLPPGARISSLTSMFQNTCFVADGAGYCWGRNQEGQMGNGTSGVGTGAMAPVRVLQGAMPAGPVDAISVGTFHTCGIAAAQVFCWGLRSGGRLGVDDGETGSLTSPGAVVGLAGRTMVEVSAGDDSTCALDSTGQAWCWGSNANGKLGTLAVGNFLSSPVPVAVQQPPGVLFTAISVGSSHACAIAADDDIYCWGAAGTLGTGPGQATALVPSVPVTASWSTP